MVPSSSVSRTATENAVALEQEILDRIPSAFGRLAFLASLRDETTGRYKHHRLAGIISDDGADKLLCEMHDGIFADWLNRTLEQQKADLDLYLSRVGIDIRAVRDTYSTLAPASATEVESRLFLSDLEILLELRKAPANSPGSS